MKKILILWIVIVLLLGSVFLISLSEKKKEQLKVQKTENQNPEINQSEIVEKYVRENIKDIATNQPVLGGTWYVDSIFVLDELKSGIVMYEDGHVQSTAFFEYKIEESSQKIIITKFEIKE